MRSQTEHPVLDYFRMLELRARSSHARDPVIAETGLPVTTLDNAALLVIARDPRTTVSKLASATGVSVARASRQAARLLEFNLITRTRDDGDGRAAVLSLTQSGHHVRELWGRHWRADYETAAGLLSDQRRAALRDGVPRLHAALAAQPEFREFAADAAAAVDGDGVGKGLVSLITFAQWTAPTITHPSYSRALIERINAPLSPQSLFLLRACSRVPTDITDLARRTNVDSSTVSRHVQRLSEMALVSRAPNPADARGTVVTMTGAGRHVLLTAESIELAPVSRALQSWEMRELNVTLDALERFVEGLRRIDAERSAPSP